MPIYVLQVIILLHCKRSSIAPSSAACLVTALCAALSNQALRRFGCGEQGCSFFRLRVQPVAQGWANHMLNRPPSILFSQHDRDHALGDRWISRIRGVVREALVEVVDLEEHLVAVGVERTKVMFFVRVVG